VNGGFRVKFLTRFGNTSLAVRRVIGSKIRKPKEKQGLEKKKKQFYCGKTALGCYSKFHTLLRPLAFKIDGI